MNPNGKKQFPSFLIVVLIMGLVGAYVPLFFSRPQATSQNPNDASSQTATVLPGPTPDVSPAPATVSTSTKEKAPEGFSGLNEESKSLDNLGNALNKKTN